LGLPQDLVATLLSASGSSSSTGLAGGENGKSCSAAAAAAADLGCAALPDALVAALEQHYLAAVTAAAGAGVGGGGSSSNSMGPCGLGALLNLAAAATGTSLAEAGGSTSSSATPAAAAPSVGASSGKSSKPSGKKKKQGTKRRTAGRWVSVPLHSPFGSAPHRRTVHRITPCESRPVASIRSDAGRRPGLNLPAATTPPCLLPLSALHVRYGNPALLAAERAKAEQGLLAALPLLAAGAEEGEEGEGEEEEEDSGEEEEAGGRALYTLDL
jgi:hypothetical protein